MDADWAAIMDSEVMRNYLKNELMKEAIVDNTIEENIDKQPIIEAFIEFEERVKSDPKMLFTFKQLQKKIASDPNYAHSCNPLFAQAVMMLDLDEQE